MTNIILCGCNGKMGHAVQNLVHQREECSIVAGVDITPQEASPFPVYASLEAVQEQAQVVVDFSNPSALSSILEYCSSHPGTAAVLCTTGYSAEQTQEIQKAAKELPLFYSRNMSLGVNLLIELAKKAESVLGDGFDVEIVEMHHNQKIDAPSGTALMIADAINQVRENSMQYVYDRHSQRKKLSDQRTQAIHGSKALEALDKLRDLQEQLAALPEVPLEFDIDLFDQLVEKIVPISNTELFFKLKCGLELKEVIPQ